MPNFIFFCYMPAITIARAQTIRSDPLVGALPISWQRVHDRLGLLDCLQWSCDSISSESKIEQVDNSDC